MSVNREQLKKKVFIALGSRIGNDVEKEKFFNDVMANIPAFVSYALRKQSLHSNQRKIKEAIKNIEVSYHELQAALKMSGPFGNIFFSKFHSEIKQPEGHIDRVIEALHFVCNETQSVPKKSGPQAEAPLIFCEMIGGFYLKHFQKTPSYSNSDINTPYMKACIEFHSYLSSHNRAHFIGSFSAATYKKAVERIRVLAKSQSKPYRYRPTLKF